MKRNKYEIVREILELCKDPASKTRIVYQCNLNFRTINPHLERLTQTELLEASGDSSVTYRTTAKGLEALKHMNALKSILGDLS
jgi:predicted transcriptional regulator